MEKTIELHQILVLPKDINEFFLDYYNTKQVDLKREFESYIRGKQTTLADRIIDVICYHQGVLRFQVESKKRDGNFVRTRTYISFFLKKKGLTLTHIGMLLGNRDHATIISRLKDFDAMYFTDKEFKANANELSKQLGIEV